MVYFFAILLFTALAILSWIDIKTFRLPNALNYALLCFGIVQAFILTSDIKTNLLGVALGYFSFVAIEKGFKALSKKDGLGRGDAKLLSAGGAWCGAFALPMIVLIASISAILAIIILQKNQNNIFPFGPFLSLAIFMVWGLIQMGYYN